MRVFVPFLFVLVFLTSCVQQIKLVETAPVSTAAGSDFILSGASPDGKSILVTKPHYFGLYHLNLKSGNLDTITELAGAGYRPAYSGSGKYIIYRTDDYSEKYRLSTIHMHNIKNGKKNLLVEDKRLVSVPYVLGNDIVFTVDGNLDCKHFNWWLATDPDDKTFVLSEDLEPELWVKGQKKRYKPAGDGSYIWISLSPDKKRLLFYLAGKGCFVSDLKGNILLDAGNLLTPSWLNNNYIVGVYSTDIAAINVKTSEKVMLTRTTNVNERNPKPFSDGKKLVYQSSAGEINIMKIYFK